MYMWDTKRGTEFADRVPSYLKSINEKLDTIVKAQEAQTKAMESMAAALDKIAVHLSSITRFKDYQD